MIEFDPLGSITVTIDDTAYRLGRPKMGQWRYFQRGWSDAVKEARGQLTDLNARLNLAKERIEDATSPPKKLKAEKEVDKLTEELREFEVKPLYEWQIPWIREVFAQLGDKPLPEDADEWPAWLATDSSLPFEIVNHWQTHPLASGEPAK